MSQNNRNIKSLSNEIITLLKESIKEKTLILQDDDFNDWKPNKLDDNNFNEVITNNTSLIVEKLKQLKILFKLLNNHIYDHKKFNFDYYFYA